MRDGIWKSLDLPNPWRRFARLCQNEASRGQSARNAARKALVLDLKRQLTRPFLADFARRAEQPPLIDDGEAAAPADSLEHAALAALRYLHRSQSSVVQAHDALALAIREQIAKYVRQCQEKYARYPDPAAADTIAAFTKIATSLDVESMAQALLRGEELSVEPVLTDVDLGKDDLSRPQ